MEPRFGRDFSHVRIHTDARAARSARAVRAQAYTSGSHIVFNSGRYSPATADGRSLLAHELAHTLQDNGARIARKANAGPDDLAENPYLSSPGEKQAEEFRRGTISVVREPILEALRKSDSITFLNRLKALDPDDRQQLNQDPSFLQEIARYLQGVALWVVQLILRFGNRRPPHVNRLHNAVFSRDTRDVKDLLRSEPTLRNPDIVPGVRAMLDHQFRGDREHDAILQVMDQAVVGGTAGIVETYREAHYEKPKGGGAYQLQSFTGHTAYKLERTSSELRVLVRIHFVEKGKPTVTAYPPDGKVSEWRSGIDGAWNNRFKATDETTNLGIVFVPLFTDQNPDHTVEVVNDKERSSEHEWHVGNVNGEAAAHEFGHMIGNPDEYRVPGRIADIPAEFGISPANAKRSSVEGVRGVARPTSVGGYNLPGIMSQTGARAEDIVAQPRHVWPVLAFFNQTMRQKGEGEFHLV